MDNDQYKRIFESGNLSRHEILWLELLNASGWAGCLPNGWIVDRRYYPNATPIAENKMMGIAKPRPLPEPPKE